jgi:GDP-L-fucose synthase
MKPRLLLTGATGFLGRNAAPVLARDYDVRAVSSRDYDLLDRSAVERMFQEVAPRIVVHLAGRVGGIGANRARPADFCHENLLMNTLVIDAAARRGVEKFVALVGGCSYPADAPHPIAESVLWAGYPQVENAPYSTAKRMVVVLLEAYRTQYGLESAVAIPGNVYGPFDNFSREGSHVVPAMIRRFHEAAERGEDTVTCWGTGAPTRDFLFAGDLVACLGFLIERYEGPEPLNIARGESTRIRDLARIAAEVTGFTGSIEWDASRPDGQPEKVLDVTRMRNLGLDCPTSLRAGVETTVRWFREHLGRGGEIRL